MEKSFSESYKKAGVDVTAGYKSVELIKKSIQSTYQEGVIGDIGGFGGIFAPNLEGMKQPILVSRNRWSWYEIKISVFNEQT